uniref:Sodium/hydrogen exchanger n=1 Tax=Hirondellea gigas TaxID=1518452 RepID=A0A6A7G718_9CRUS
MQQASVTVACVSIVLLLLQVNCSAAAEDSLPYAASQPVAAAAAPGATDTAALNSSLHNQSAVKNESVAAELNINALSNKATDGGDDSGIPDINTDIQGDGGIGVIPSPYQNINATSNYTAINLDQNGHTNDINIDLNNNLNNNNNEVIGVGSNAAAAAVSGTVEDAPEKTNINSEQNSNGEVDMIATVAPSLQLHLGNTTLADACSLSKDDYQQLLLFYPHHCLKLDEPSEDSDVVVSNLTANACQESEDLPSIGAAEQEHLSSLSIFLILCILGLCVLLIFCLLKTKLHYLPESVACVLVGAVIGLLLKILSSQNIANWQKEEAFSPTVFFLIILPPIIFESGYNLHKGNFFQNIGSILVFAVLGTIISALVVGGGVYLLGRADVVYKLTFVESFAFGSLISAVDPVATLALFNALQVDPILHMLVFGESILNDAVSIVLTSSVLEMASYGDMGVLETIGYFLWRFCTMILGSAGIGVLFGLMSALTLKHVALRDYTSLELCILIIFIYAPYALAEGIHLSGIMAILFSGIVMSHYTHYNLSPVLQITVQHLMRTLAFTAECIVFIYLGMALFSFKHQFHGALVGWSIVLCLVGRALNIFPLACLVNRFRDHPITPKMMFVMWFSGLRGAIAYALSLHLEFSDEKRHVLVTTTLFIVLFTVVILGGSVIPLIKHVEADRKQKKKVRRKKMLTLSKTREWGQAVESEHMSEMTEEESSEGARYVSSHQLRGFLKLDTCYLRPFFCRNLTHQEVRSHANDLKRQCYQSLNVEPSDSEDEMFSLTTPQQNA